jgi:hypothetical protein
MTQPKPRPPRADVLAKDTAAARALAESMRRAGVLRNIVLAEVQGQPAFPSLAALMEVAAAVLAVEARCGAQLDDQVKLATAILHASANNAYDRKLELIEARGNTVVSVAEIVADF